MHLFRLFVAGVLAAVTACASASFKPYNEYDTKTPGLRAFPRAAGRPDGQYGEIQWVCNNDAGRPCSSVRLAKHHMKVEFDGAAG